MKKSVIEILQDIRDRNYETGQRLIDDYFFSNNPETQKHILTIARNE